MKTFYYQRQKIIIADVSLFLKPSCPDKTKPFFVTVLAELSIQNTLVLLKNP